MADNPAWDGLFDDADRAKYASLRLNSADGPAGGGQVTVTPADLKARAGTVSEIQGNFHTVDDTADEKTTTAYAALTSWQTGPELRNRSMRWDNQVATLGNMLYELADRLRKTADQYTATENANKQNLSGGN
ncbi:type VII secretion target [Kitasatospora brasiliensis]|uniref:type VII secretion target n=1 Tax=Kitasatospora brasiliensis TaxID=3058040 RepID=UPI00292DC582|nr:type VII secretion target [Kitasatospora sp. K002]